MSGRDEVIKILFVYKYSLFLLHILYVWWHVFSHFELMAPFVWEIRYWKAENRSYQSVGNTQRHHRIWVWCHFSSYERLSRDRFCNLSAFFVVCFHLQIRSHELCVTFNLKVQLFSRDIYDVMICCSIIVVVHRDTSFRSMVQRICKKTSFFICLKWWCDIIFRN